MKQKVILEMTNEELKERLEEEKKQLQIELERYKKLLGK